MASSGGGPAVAQSLQPAFLVNPQHKCDPVKQVTFKASHSRKEWEGGSDRVSRGELTVCAWGQHICTSSGVCSRRGQYCPVETCLPSSSRFFSSHRGLIFLA